MLMVMGAGVISHNDRRRKERFIFDDAMSNVWKKTVVQSDKQFPTVLRRFLL